MTFSLFRFTLRPEAPLELPRFNKGNTLRGAFGLMFRRVCCRPECPGATQCELRQSCPYALLFEPGAPPGAAALRNYQAIPRPFVFRPPLEEKTHYAAGEAFEFGLVLAGKSAEYLPQIVSAFAELTEEGFGLNRARVKLEKVEQMPGRLETCPTSSRIQIQFLTPTHLVFEEKTVREPEFHHLIRRLRDRLNALATFYGDGPLDLDFAGLGERAQQVRCVSRDLRWEERARMSSKRGQRHEIGGFTGCCEFEGDLSEFAPLLAMGELAHVGKHTAWGNGWFRCSGVQ